MSRPDYEHMVATGSDLFAQPEEEIFSVPIDYPRPYPIYYSAYDVGVAAIDAMIESDRHLFKKGIAEIIYIREAVEDEIMRQNPHWETIVKARSYGALALNNYGGRDIPFCPN